MSVGQIFAAHGLGGAAETLRQVGGVKGHLCGLPLGDALDRIALQHLAQDGGTARIGRHEHAQLPGDDLVEQAIGAQAIAHGLGRSDEHTSELQSLMRTSYAVFCLKNNNPTLSYPDASSYVKT